MTPPRMFLYGGCMTSTANNTQQQPAEHTLTWTRLKVWGSVGMTHRAATEINGETWTFTVDSPSKGQWVARAWRDGDFALYREDKTMKGAKGQAQAHANYAATQTCAECKEIGGHTLACDAGRYADMVKSAERGECIGLRTEVTEVQDSIVITLKDEGAEVLDATETLELGPAGEFDEAAWQAEWDSRPEGSDVRDLIEITPVTPAQSSATLPDAVRNGDGGPDEIGPAILRKLEPAEAQQLMAELEETFPHLAEWKRGILGARLKSAGDQLGQVAETMANDMGPAVVSAAESMSRMTAAIERVQAARDRVQMRKETCGCRTPLHTMRCGVGGRARVISSAVSA